MPLFKAKVPPVLDQLSAKEDKLATNSVSKEQAADSLIRQAGDLRLSAQTDAAHREAVTKALAILAEAGVNI